MRCGVPRGRHVVKIAAAQPDIFRATARFHGTFLVADSTDSPRLFAPGIEGEIYFGLGEEDPFTPPDVIGTVKQAFDAGPATVSCRLHEDTDHGYAIPDTGIYNKTATDEKWYAIFAMFRTAL